MDVGILGSGVVGQALARGFADRGHDVRIGSRSPEKLADFAAETGVGTGSFEQTADHGQLLVLATAGQGTLEAIDLVGAQRLAGKVVIDATNPLVFAEGAPPGLFVGTDDSLGEQVQRAAPDARVVKCFNIITAGAMVDPQLDDGPPTMFIGGDEAQAKKTVIDVLHAFGWPDVVDLGGIDASRMLEPIALAWVTLGIRRNSWAHAFRLIT